jgi:hypothetical protein
VHSVRLEWLGENRAVHYGETVAAHWLDEPGIEASTSGCLGVVPESLVAASETEGVTLALASAVGSSVVA